MGISDRRTAGCFIREVSFLSLQIQKIYQDTAKTYQIHKLTGDSGLTRECSWVQLCKDIDTVKFLRGGELVITTGLMCERREGWLQAFIEQLVRYRASGLILNIGKYLTEQDISEGVLTYCAQKDFALFTIPWHIRFADIVQDYGKRLLLAQQNQLNFEMLVRGAISSSCQKDDYLQALSGGMYPHTVFRLKLYEIQRESIHESAKQSIAASWKRMLNHLRRPYLLFFQQNYLLLILFYKNPEESFELPEKMIRSLPEEARPQFCGESQVHLEYAGLTEAYQQAEAALEVARLTEKQVMQFDDIGVYSVFFALKDTRILRKLYESMLVPLLRYDEQHNAQLAPTLRYYLFHMNSLQETARAMYAHRNTVSYRINKIKEITGADFDDAVVCFDYMLAYYVGDYFKMKDIVEKQE